MAEDIEGAGKAAKPPEAGQPSDDTQGELPTVESPALSPAGDEPETVPASALVILPPAGKSGTQSSRPRFRVGRRFRRRAAFAASVVMATGIGVLAGAFLTRAPSVPRPDPASLHRQQALQQSVSRLDKELASLKAGLANEAKSAHSQIAKISERLRNAPEITGSIPVPPAAVPTPIPRPAMRTAAQSQVVRDWRIHDVRGGFVYVQGHGDIYQVVPGAPLPGLGPVQEIKRRDGRWVVVTPKGLIVSMRDRRYFGAN
jgi:hypothetical protein